MKKKYLSGHFAYKSDVGRVRLLNEDRVMALINARGNALLVVCDGMGGAKKGDLASTLALDTIVEEFKNREAKFLGKLSAKSFLTAAIKKANRTVYNEAEKNPDYKGMGTTLTAVLIVNNFYVLAQVGDSRCYTINNNRIKQLSEDQTYAAYLYRIGQITKEQMDTHPKRHILTNSLGIYPSISIDMRVDNYNDETFLLCSDGLYNNVDDGNIESILLSDDGVDIKINELISLANANGGSDNIGVVIWEADK